MRLNSSITINLASMCAIILILFDLMIRINMHIYDNCEDNLAFVGYQIEFQRQFCVPKIHNLSDNMTLWEIYNQAENVYPIGCVKCPSYLTLRILGACVLFMESIKFLLGFLRLLKSTKKQSLTLKKYKELSAKRDTIKRLIAMGSWCVKIDTL